MCATDKNDKKVNLLHAAVSALIVAVIFVAVLVVCGITPFGDGTFLMFDLKRQYVDYYAYYRTVISGENNIRYSFAATLGSGTLGFFAYYLMSPFLIILSMFDQAGICAAITGVIGLKLMLAAFLMDIFLQIYICKPEKIAFFDQISAAIYVGAVSWGFSGFLFAHSMNMMWTDVVILFPIYILCLEMLLKEDRKAPFIVVLWGMLVLNYYITFQVILFTVLWTIMRIAVSEYEKPIKLLFRVAGCGMVSGAMSAALLLPTAIELMNSPKDITQLGLKLTGKNLTPLDIFSKLPTLAYDYIEARFGYPQIYCGVLLVALTLLYFMSRKVPVREKVGMFCLLSIMMISFCLDVVNIIWHAGMEPSGHPYRQAYLFVFLMIICSTRAMSILDSEINLIKLGISFALMVVTLFFIRRNKYDHISDLTVIASYGMIVAYAVLFIAFSLSTRREKKLLPAIFVLFLLGNIADLTANSIYTYHYQAMLSEKAGEYSKTVSDTLEAVNYIKQNDSSFYRVENLSPRQQNDSMQYNYNGITHYSSAGMTYVRYFLQRLGFNEDGLYVNYGRDNTETADSLLGIRYHITGSGDKSHHDYVKIYDEEKVVYENPYALPISIETEDYDLSGISDPEENIPDNGMSHVPIADAFTLQEEIYGRLLKREVNIFTKAEVRKSDLEETEGKYSYFYDVKAMQDGEMYLYIAGLIGESENLVIYVDGELFSTYGNASCVKVLNLGFFDEGDEILVQLQGESMDYNFGEAFFVTEDVEALKQACDELRSRSGEVTRKSSSHLVIDTGDCNGVFITVPYEKGWNITVDGRKVEPVAVYDSLTYVPIDTEGTSHTVEMIFTPEGIWVGLIFSISGLLILVYLAISGKKGILL